MCMKMGALNQYHVIENQNLNIAAAKSIGISIFNLSVEDLRDAVKNPILVLGFMWQAVKMQLLGSVNLKSHPELIALVNDGEDMNDLLGLPPEELLKRWVNYHLEKQEYPDRITDFSGDVKDGKEYTVLPILFHDLTITSTMQSTSESAATSAARPSHCSGT